MTMTSRIYTCLSGQANCLKTTTTPTAGWLTNAKMYALKYNHILFFGIGPFRSFVQFDWNSKTVLFSVSVVLSIGVRVCVSAFGLFNIKTLSYRVETRTKELCIKTKKKWQKPFQPLKVNKQCFIVTCFWCNFGRKTTGDFLIQWTVRNLSRFVKLNIVHLSLSHVLKELSLIWWMRRRRMRCLWLWACMRCVCVWVCMPLMYVRVYVHCVWNVCWVREGREASLSWCVGKHAGGKSQQWVL